MLLPQAELTTRRSSPLVWQIEAALERTRLFLALHDTGWEGEARERLDEAERLVRQTEKPYEPHVPEWSDWQPPEYVGVFKKGEIVGYHCRNDEIERLQKQIG